MINNNINILICYSQQSDKLQAIIGKELCSPNYINLALNLEMIHTKLTMNCGKIDE